MVVGHCYVSAVYAHRAWGGRWRTGNVGLNLVVLGQVSHVRSDIIWRKPLVHEFSDHLQPFHEGGAVAFLETHGTRSLSTREDMYEVSENSINVKVGIVVHPDIAYQVVSRYVVGGLGVGLKR